jgi:hypothetical protein
VALGAAKDLLWSSLIPIAAIASSRQDLDAISSAVDSLAATLFGSQCILDSDFQSSHTLLLTQPPTLMPALMLTRMPIPLRHTLINYIPLSLTALHTGRIDNLFNYYEDIGKREKNNHNNQSQIATC